MNMTNLKDDRFRCIEAIYFEKSNFFREPIQAPTHLEVAHAMRDF